MVKWGILNAPYFCVLTPKVYLLPEFEGPSSKTRQLENGLKMGSIRFINKKSLQTMLILKIYVKYIYIIT